VAETIDFSAYNPAWPLIFDHEAQSIQGALQGACLAIHHVGSTAVPGLAAKPTIDIIAVIRPLAEVRCALEHSGYAFRGEYNIPFRGMYTKRCPHDINLPINLHVYPEGHPEIALNILFRDCLRTNGETRAAYGALKATLAQAHDAAIKSEGAMFCSYTLGKDVFITGVLDAVGFSLPRFMRVTSPREWDAYHAIFKSQIFDPLGLIYDTAHPSFSAPNNHRFVWCRGSLVVSGVHVEKISQSVAALRGLATHGEHQRQGYGRQLMGQVETWLKQQGIGVVKLHARPSAVPFYEGLGYGPMVFDDPSIQWHPVDMGKVL
jgi:GrpB-like predicted nucleotidyltransferase (UPF0157 family)/GNAT superfamily N-acetyltransferase